MKRHAPATLRNRDAIVHVLERELPESGTVLEVASGSGEHAVVFAKKFAAYDWQPSDTDADALGSIAEYRAEAGLTNLLEPIALDAAQPNWDVQKVAAILCINMVHISPWEATEGLFANAAQSAHVDAPLILYGPYFEDVEEPAQSNLDFDASLKSRDRRWGIRNLADMDALAMRAGFGRTARYAMPANNLTLIYRRS